MSAVTKRRRFLLPEMEGRSARWYARQRNTPNQVTQFRTQAAELTKGLAPGAAVLEVAPGPGILAIEMARLGFAVTGLDVSHTMVEIAREAASAAAVEVDFREGDASATPFAGGSFDLVVCQAAFKNFRQPLDALNEMARVLKPGGQAVIQDMNQEATGAAIAAEVREQGLTWLNGFITRRVLEGLRRRAYTPARFEQLAAASDFGGCKVYAKGIGLEVRLRK
jgi:ubiquinone/menaquinone biosynthesis C-methylase UbiE